MSNCKYNGFYYGPRNNEMQNLFLNNLTVNLYLFILLQLKTKQARVNVCTTAVLKFFIFSWLKNQIKFITNKQKKLHIHNKIQCVTVLF